MSTPEMRATCSSFSRTPDPLPSTLALLVARVLADDDDLPVPADHFALFTHRLDARSNLHVLVLVSYCSHCTHHCATRHCATRHCACTSRPGPPSLPRLTCSGR